MIRPEIELNNIFQLRIEDLRTQRKARWRALLEASGGNFFLFGAGELGMKTLQGLLGEGIRPIAMLDNKVTANVTHVLGIPIYTPSQAATMFGTGICCLIAVFNTYAPRQQLASLGFQHVSHCLDVFAALPERFLPYVCLDNTDVIFRQATQVRAAFELMADEASRHAFVAQLRHRLFLDFDTVICPQTPLMRSSEYFPNDLYRYLDNEVLLDCGAFRGDTISRLIEKRGEAFSHIYGLEPDRLSFAALQIYVEGLGSDLSHKITPLPYGAGSKSEFISFQESGSVRSGLSDSGTDLIRLESLDELFSNATLIKMDIEGNELEALRGARKLLADQEPVLAICVYHANAHLWEVPLLIAKIQPNYRFFVRAHAEDCWDVTCYAVPPNRCLS